MKLDKAKLTALLTDRCPDLTVAQVDEIYKVCTEAGQLTAEAITAMSPGIFGGGRITDSALLQRLDSFEMHEIQYVAVRGGGPSDWTIYYGPASWPVESVRYQGWKVTSDDIIANLVPCTAEALNTYRK